MKKLLILVLLLAISLPALAQQPPARAGGSPTVGTGSVSPTSAFAVKCLSVAGVQESCAGGATTPSAAVTVTVTSPTITAVSSIALAANAGRKGCIMQNVGSSNVRYNYSGGPASATNDATLFPFQTRTCADLGVIPTGAITMITESGTSIVSITEGN